MRYFYFNQELWKEVFGEKHPEQKKYAVTQIRQGDVIWVGQCVSWVNDNGVHGNEFSFLIQSEINIIWEINQNLL